MFFTFLKLHKWGIPQKSDLGPGNRDTGPIRETRDLGPSTGDPSPGTRDLEPVGGAQDPGPSRGTQDLGPSNRDPSPGTWDLISDNLDPIPLCGTRGPSLKILTLIQLSLYKQFSSVA